MCLNFFPMWKTKEDILKNNTGPLWHVTKHIHTHVKASSVVFHSFGKTWGGKYSLMNQHWITSKACESELNWIWICWLIPSPTHFISITPGFEHVHLRHKSNQSLSLRRHMACGFFYVYRYHYSIKKGYLYKQANILL